MKRNVLVILLVSFTEITTFSRWFSCWLFQNEFYFTFQNLTTQLLVSSNEEKGLPLILIRILHNKITGILWGFGVTFLQYIDIRFVMTLLGIAGAIGLYMGFWYFFTKNIKNYYLWTLLILLVAFSLIEMFFVPRINFAYRIIPLALALGSLSLVGVWEFIRLGNKKIRVSIMIVLIVLSLCSLILFPHDLYIMCLKV